MIKYLIIFMLPAFIACKNKEKEITEDVDLGVFYISERESDKYLFNVPGLLNTAHIAPYFHD